MRNRRLIWAALPTCVFAASCSADNSDAGNANGGATSSSGGATASGGTSQNGSNGGKPANGGTTSASGGSSMTASGGSLMAGGGAGKASAGGASSGGTSGANNSGGSAGAPGTTNCKRGIAANTAPGTAFSGSITWWYNWAISGTGAGSGIEFVPMVWGSGSVNANLPTGAKFLLTFNEPNFHAQANLTAQQAASYWPTLEAKAAGIPLVSPAMNFCGPAANCNGTNPYQYLKDFFAACTNCQVDYVAVHWYNCDLPSLRDYLEPGGNLEGFEQFGKPIWLTEFSCDENASVEAQETFMRAAIPYLEQSTKVFRYSWFSANPIPNAKLINSDGSPTALGRVYMELPQSCP
ncbi:MAG: glycosyl hydrolase [Myxococcota bacterium]